MFKAELKAFMMAIFHQDIKQPDWIVAHITEKHLEKWKAELIKSGIVISETDLDQALDKWIEILDNIQQEKDANTAIIASKEAQKEDTARKTQQEIIECLQKRKQLDNNTDNKSNFSQFSL